MSRVRAARKKMGFVWPLCLGGALVLAILAGVLIYRQMLETETESMKKDLQIVELQGRILELETDITVLESRIEGKDAAIELVKEELDRMNREEEERLEAERLAAEAAKIGEVSPEEVAVGDVLEEEALPQDVSLFFTAHEIVEGDAVYERINGKSYRKNPHVALSDLRYLRVLHYNFDHKPQMGELIVNTKVADDVLSIFRELYDVEYEIQSMYLVDNYWTGDGGTSDSASIDVNNTSAFNYRAATGSSNLSNHAYGLAIDINPQQNPYLWRSGNGYKYAHTNAASFIDRDMDDPHIIVKGDVCYEIFKKYGFSWGGEWSNPIDYQHFEKE